LIQLVVTWKRMSSLSYNTGLVKNREVTDDRNKT